MKIIWLGHAMFEIIDTNSGMKIITDPYSSEVGYPVEKRSADILTVSHDHYDHNNTSIVNARLVLNSETEAKFDGLKVSSITTYHDDAQGTMRGKNLVFKFEGEATVVHLGDYGEKFLRSEVKEFISGADVMLVPVGGIYTIGPKEAAQLVKETSPKIAVPMHYKTPHLRFDLSGVEEFLSEAGLLVEEREELLLEDEEIKHPGTKVVVLKYRV